MTNFGLKSKFLLCTLLVAAAGLSATNVVGGDLMVLPSEVVLSADYPARIVLIEKLADETWVDRTRSDQAEWTIDRPEWIRLADGAPGLLEVRAREKADGQIVHLSVRIDGQSVTVPVRIACAQRLSPTFPREVAAVLSKSGCNLGTCHGNLHGKSGFRLSLRGDDPALDFTGIVRGSVGRRIDRINPEDSLLIRKPLGDVAHQGGARFTADSPEAEILRRWIAEGCQWNAVTGAPWPLPEDAPRADETLLGLDVFPSRALLAKQCRQQQLVVIARFADGSRRDVTRWARFEPSVVTGVDIDPTGLVKAAEAVDVSISISYLTGRAASRLTFLPHEKAQWSEPPAESRVDQLVEQQLHRLQVRPAPAADDFVFVRRAYLTIVGRLPTADEVRRFTTSDDRDSDDRDKDQRLIESLLNDPGYALLWAMRWSDLLRNEQKVMSQQGAEGWHAWIAAQIASDRPLSEFVAEMLTTLGSTYEHPAASFHRTHRDPETAAESIGQVFLGVRLQCARCHNHPFDNWRQDDYYGLAAYFTRLERKQLENSPKDKFDKHIISGDEIISLTGSPAEIWHPGRAAKVGPKPLTEPFERQHGGEPQQGGAEQHGGEPPQGEQANSGRANSGHADEGETDGSPLEELAAWLTTDNRMFARNMANRIWYHYIGVGIVDPPDDFRDSNPPSNPELLEYLTDELIRSNYSARHVARLILTSRIFRRQSASEPSATEPLGGARVFCGYPLRRMPAEVLYDAISDVTGVVKAPDGPGLTTTDMRAVARVEVPTKAGFLTTFGKPGRLLVCECERSSEVSLGQSLVLVNGLETREKLSSRENLLERLIADDQPLEQSLAEIYLTALARHPRGEELERLSEYVAAAPSRRSALEDVLWALLNSKEFPLIR